ncbi:MAG: isoleucine--tRNA ligase [Bacteroidetes bacterium]|nr:isoleucine--tRNA ligase [Bacteroidota bacterium]
MAKYPEYKKLDLPELSKEILNFWKQERVFEKSIASRPNDKPWVFYEGPPSANGMPGIHHVMARTIKDIFCRFKTLQGYQVKRKAGWDTHGLPIELGVEKTLGITKEDIGNKKSAKYISVEDYNKACRREVMKFTDKWEELTSLMGYWVDMGNPYITYDNKYIETCWYLLKNLYNKELLYKGYTIQPYSPAAGTGLSSAELNQPGCYRNVKDRTATVMFKLANSSKLNANGETYFLAWTTTPWTLPSNTALAVGSNIEYVLVETYNPFTYKKIHVILAEELLQKYFPEKNAEISLDDYKPGDKNIPYKTLKSYKGSELAGIAYEQLLPFVKPSEQAFKVICADFVTTTDGTGIVHIAPSFGADDYKAAKENNITTLTLVDKRGKFLPEINDTVFLYGGEYVKEAYLSQEEKEAEFKKQKQTLEAAGKIKDLKVYLSVDERIVLKLQEEGKLFKKETYEHSYPHCWRTDKPVLYYPLDSWFVRVADNRQKLVELNKKINWKPESTGTGRFGNWLENALDWNLSRSRFWGIPLPIWTSEDRTEQLCIGSAEELQSEIKNAINKGAMKSNPLMNFKPGNFSTENYSSFDLHKPYADEIILERNGKKLYRESDLIDVWFDSGAMPYAQLHYPFENKDLIENNKTFPADFIAEGVDQTRGWFYTLHVIGALSFNSIAYKNVVSNGLVLDKNGNKMSKRLGNAADPFETIHKFGADATRWYMIANAAPWDNLKFDAEGISEVQRKLFGTLYNTYNFFALYANVDNFIVNENNATIIGNRTELDRWILSELQTLIENVTEAYESFEPHRAARFIENFVDEHLSNWYVRLSRRRFWKGEMSEDKKAAYETLHQCISVLAQLMSPIAPFFSEWLYSNLKNVNSETTATSILNAASVHLSNLVVAEKKHQDKALEERMELAQKISSMILSIRKKENIKVRQPLQKIQIPILDQNFQAKIETVKDIILSEVNVKELEFVTEEKVQIVKNLKLNFKTLGKMLGQKMKDFQTFALQNPKQIILEIEKNGLFNWEHQGSKFTFTPEDFDIIPVDIPGWKVANSGALTVAIDITITENLKQEGIARELVNRIQNMRKDQGFDLTDKILVKIQQNDLLDAAIKSNFNYICNETLTSDLKIVSDLPLATATKIEVDELINTLILIEKLN